MYCNNLLIRHDVSYQSLKPVCFCFVGLKIKINAYKYWTQYKIKVKQVISFTASLVILHLIKMTLNDSKSSFSGK